MKTGCYWGRFNPPHKGHMKMIKNMLKRVDKLIITVGRGEAKNTKRDPFSAKERIQMLKSYLKEEGIKNVKIISVTEGKSYHTSVNRLLKACPNINILFADKKTIIDIVGKKIEVGIFKRTGNVSATKLRDNIAYDKKWENLTGKSVANLIKKLNGIKRIKKAYGVLRR